MLSSLARNLLNLFNRGLPKEGGANLYTFRVIFEYDSFVCVY